MAEESSGNAIFGLWMTKRRISLREPRRWATFLPPTEVSDINDEVMLFEDIC